MKTKIKELIQLNKNKVEKLKNDNEICKKLCFLKQVDHNNAIIDQLTKFIEQLESLL